MYVLCVFCVCMYMLCVCVCAGPCCVRVGVTIMFQYSVNIMPENSFGYNVYTYYLTVSNSILCVYSPADSDSF